LLSSAQGYLPPEESGVANGELRQNLMAAKIRLMRTGAKNRPCYRIVVTHGASPRDGRFIEALGSYDPKQKDSENFTMDLERAEYWLGVGAQPSETVKSLIKAARKGAGKAKGEPLDGKTTHVPGERRRKRVEVAVAGADGAGE